MRHDEEMIGQIIQFARNDERIRAVMMNGSRANPNAPRDIFQDYDIVYFVTSVKDFVRDRSWIRSFGEIMMIQTPDEMGNPEAERRDAFTFLMLFADGVRIDLTYYPAGKLDQLDSDSLSVVLLDKDGILGHVPEPSVQDYLTAPPTAKQFADCCNEFWWVSTNIAKGLWRAELSYSKFMYERPVRDMLVLMIRWLIGTRKGFDTDTGKYGKYFERHLKPEEWDAFVRTFPDGQYDRIWDGLIAMTELFRAAAQEVAGHYGYAYQDEDDRRISDYIRRVRNLPRSADRIY